MGEWSIMTMMLMIKSPKINLTPSTSSIKISMKFNINATVEDIPSKWKFWNLISPNQLIIDKVSSPPSQYPISSINLSNTITQRAHILILIQFIRKIILPLSRTNFKDPSQKIYWKQEDPLPFSHHTVLDFQDIEL